MVINGAVEAGHPWIAAVFLLGAVMTILYLLRAFVRVFLGRAREEHTQPEGSASMVFSVSFLASLSIISGLLIYLPADLIQKIIMQING